VQCAAYQQLDNAMASRPVKITHAHHTCGDDHAHAHDALPAHHDRGHSLDHGQACCAADPSAPSPSGNASPVTARIPAGYTLTRLRVAEMDCPTEEALIRNKLGGLAAVRGVEFNLMQRVLTVVHQEQRASCR
jgi:Cd2+/Zn2+-exporting ATPase